MVRYLASCSLVAGMLSFVSVHGQTSLVIYSDALVNGFQDWSWVPPAQRNFNNASPVHTGSRSIYDITTNEGGWQ